MKNSLLGINGILQLNLRFTHKQGYVAEPVIKFFPLRSPTPHPATFKYLMGKALYFAILRV